MHVPENIHGEAALWLLAGSTLLHEIGVPLPITPVALFLAARAVNSARDLVAFTAVMVVATLLGNLLWFNGGRRHGRDVLKHLCRFSLISQTRIANAERTFEQWGPLALVLGRMVPGITLFAPPLAGALGMSRYRFLGLTSIGAALYSVCLLGAGVVFRDQIEAILRSVESIGYQAVVALALMVGGYLAWHWLRRRGGPNRTVPSVGGASSYSHVDTTRKSRQTS